MEIEVNALGEFNRLAHDGSKQAANSLGQLTGVRPTVEATSIDLLRRRDIIADLHNQDLIGISSEFSGGIAGTALLVFNEAGARTLAKSLPGDGAEAIGLESRLTELGNIMLSGFIDGWADYLNQAIDQRPPTYLTGGGTDIIPDATPIDQASNQVLTVNTTFETSSAVVETTAYVFLEEASFRHILDTRLTSESTPIPLDKLQVFSRMAAKGGDTAGDSITMMTGIDTSVTVSRMSFLQVEQIGPRLGDEQQVGVVAKLTGLPTGYVLVLFDEPSAETIAEAMGTGAVTDGFDGIHESAIEEISNIMISGFVDGWANVLGTSNQHTPPEFVHDFTSAIVDPIMLDLATTQEYVFGFDTLIKTAGDAVSCKILALPRAEELKEALDELSVGELSADVEAEMEADPESLFQEHVE
ncbi:chemotaxis protein CheC [Halorubrum ezzemoulense]|uniref:chemotaxis protein CheC n=1 Tax=Halorubrum ezzemoulense TaxID=337243 RepID=UPI00232FCD32|nr:chemotaxis protein CheC [Halorubrum ezzemoulense]MDB2223432.1 chemotaxis protein CheC [Halorubrum ezzemoulense]